MTLQISALRTDDLEEHLAARIERRLTALADELEHAQVVVYDADRGLATRGGVLRMTLADLAAIVAAVVVETPAPIAASAVSPVQVNPPVGRHVAR